MRRSFIAFGGALALTTTLASAQFAPQDYYVSSPAGGGIYRGGAQNGETTPVGLGLLIPHYGWFGNDGNFYVPDRGWNSIMKITPAGNVSVLTAGGILIKPVTVIPTLDDAAWVVSDMEASAILRVGYDGSQQLMHDAASTNGLLYWPDGMAYDDDGNLYVANLGNDTIVKIDPQGNASLFSDDPIIWEPGGIAIDGAGNLFVANYAFNSIARFRLDTGEGEVFAEPGSDILAKPNDIKLARTGGLLASGRYGRVTRIDALGNSTVVFENPELGELDGVSVPEDATLCTGRFTMYGEGTPGSGGIVPQFRAIFSPCAGQIIGLELKDFLGGAPATMFVGTSALPQGALKFKGAPLLVDPGSAWFLILPLVFPGSGPGNGDLTLQFTVPAMPGLEGLTLYHQVFAADPAAPTGISASNGLKEVFGV